MTVGPARWSRVHEDIEERATLRDGGQQAYGRGSSQHLHAKREHEHDDGDRAGHDFVHSAVDDHSRLAYCQTLPDEQAPTAYSLGGMADGSDQTSRRTPSPCSLSGRP